MLSLLIVYFPPVFNELIPKSDLHKMPSGKDGGHPSECPENGADGTDKFFLDT